MNTEIIAVAAYGYVLRLTHRIVIDSTVETGHAAQKTVVLLTMNLVQLFSNPSKSCFSLSTKVEIRMSLKLPIAGFFFL